MKRSIQHSLTVALVAFLTGAATPSVQAADRSEARKAAPVERAMRFRDHVRKVASELDLTDAQKQELRAIFQKEREALLELRDNDSLTRKEKIAALREIRSRVLDAIKGVLTVEQWETWLQLREDQRDAIRDHVGA